jgi:hypothetical protein
MKEDTEYWKGRAERAEAYCQDYGNSNGTCEAGYWQHPNYVCHHCGHDRSAERVCPIAIAKEKETEMATKTDPVKKTKSPKLKIIVEIKAEYTVDSLSEIADIQENIDRACEHLQGLGSAEAETRFEVIDG